MTRPVRFALLALAVVAAGVGAYSLGLALRPPPEPSGTPVESRPDVSGLSLVNGDGQPMTLGAFEGDVVLVYFGYTRCPDVCPLTMGRLAKAYEDLGAPDDLDVVMITVDPEHDTPEVVDAYARGFDPAFIGLGGSNRQVAEAARAFYVGYASIGGPAFSHTDAVVVLDRSGHMRLVYGQEKVMDLMVDLPAILADASFR